MTFISIEDCGRGLECPIHYRIQDHQTDGVISLIDYVGEYAVHTYETALSEALWALVTGEEFSDFHVKVYRVGKNGTLAELADDLNRFALNVIRSEGHYIPEPDESMTDDQVEGYILDQIRAAHEITIGLIKAEVISA